MTSIRWCMACVAGTIVVWSGLLAAPGLAQESGARTKLRYQALNVFQKYCLQCHDDSPKGDVRVLDHALLVKERQVIRPGSPETSELFDLVQGGSMPPGNNPKVPETELAILKDWIQKGAEALPSTHDESYVLWSIVCHLRTKSAAEKRSIRYLSLNHLLERENSSLVQQRQRVEQMLRNLAPAGKKTPLLQPIERTQSVFCIDLKELGWDRPPYPEAEEQRWHRLNMFDLILLEYPHGRLPTEWPFYRDGLVSFLLELQEAGQVRPITYVRADWLADVFEQPRSPLYQDFLKLLGKSDEVPRRKGIQQPEAAPSGNLELAADGYGDRNVARKGLERGGAIPDSQHHSLRGAEDKNWRARHDERLIAELLKKNANPGIAILPLDGITYPDVVSTNPMFAVQFRAVDFKDLVAAKQENREPRPQNVFAPDEEFGLWFKASEAARIEIYFAKHKKITEEPRTIEDPRNGEALTPSGLPLKLKNGVTEETEAIVLFAYPVAALDNAHTSFPKGSPLHAEGIHDRVVHLLYELEKTTGQVKPPDPNLMVKVTLNITTRRP